MTTQTVPVQPPTTRSDLTAALATAVGLGIALGVVDLVLILLLPYPFADLANSSAMWAVAAFLLARSLRADVVVSAAAGAVLLVVGVQSYYLAAAAIDLASTGSLVTGPTLTWCALGVLAGGAFGAAGAWSRHPDVWRAAGSVAFLSAVLLAEAWLRRSWGDTALLTAGIGLAALVVGSRDQQVLARAAAVVVPLTLLCVGGFAVAGF